LQLISHIKEMSSEVPFVRFRARLVSVLEIVDVMSRSMMDR